MPLLALRDLRNRFDLYLNGSEYDQIAAAAATARLPMSTFIRRSALRVRISAPPSEVSTKRWQELARVGANLNQLSHSVNSGRVQHVDLAIISDLQEQVRLLRLELLGIDGEDRSSLPK